ncbi:hypothetical protein ABZ434_27745 [Streptomyces sp. NPDC005761]|uniref:hypothetical protein n=1 Tax=Streptomyces sp. NPDC005761 TaxID=3157066 RepID=UPI00340BFB05
MPRKRPGALRAAPDRTPVWLCEPGRISSLSLATSAAIRRVEYAHEDYEVYPGVTSAALLRYRLFLARPGRILWPSLARCSCPGCSLDDVTHVRDALAEVLALLPARPRAELSRLVTRLDRRLLRRTLPSPHSASDPWRSRAWWRMRLYDGEVDPP